MKVIELLNESNRHNPTSEFRTALEQYSKKFYNAVMKPNKSTSIKIEVLFKEGRSKSVKEQEISVKDEKFFHGNGISPAYKGVGNFLSGDDFNTHTELPTATQKNCTVLYTLSNDDKVYMCCSVVGVDGKTKFTLEITSITLASGNMIGDIPIGGTSLSAIHARKLGKKLVNSEFKNVSEIVLEAYEEIQKKLINKAGL